jgi:hypothetical protein
MTNMLTTYRYDAKWLQPFLVIARVHIGLVCHKRLKEDMTKIILNNSNSVFE